MDSKREDILTLSRLLRDKLGRINGQVEEVLGGVSGEKDCCLPARSDCDGSLTSVLTGCLSAAVTTEHLVEQLGLTLGVIRDAEECCVEAPQVEAKPKKPARKRKR